MTSGVNGNVIQMAQVEICVKTDTKCEEVSVEISTIFSILGKYHFCDVSVRFRCFCMLCVSRWARPFCKIKCKLEQKKNLKHSISPFTLCIGFDVAYFPNDWLCVQNHSCSGTHQLQMNLQKNFLELRGSNTHGSKGLDLSFTLVNKVNWLDQYSGL